MFLSADYGLLPEYDTDTERGQSRPQSGEWAGGCACEGRELSGVGVLAIVICRRVCHGVRGAYRGDSPGCCASLALGTSCGKSSNQCRKRVI